MEFFVFEPSLTSSSLCPTEISLSPSEKMSLVGLYVRCTRLVMLLGEVGDGHEPFTLPKVT